MNTHRLENPSLPRARKTFLALVIVALLIFIAFRFSDWNLLDKVTELFGNKHQVASVNSRPVTPRGELDAGEQATIKLFQAASPSVVFVTTLAVRRDFFRLGCLSKAY